MAKSDYDVFYNDDYQPKTVVSAKKAAQLLRREIAILKGLAPDFRDMEPGSQAWQVFLKAFPQKREEVEKWIRGPVLVFQGLEDFERRFFETSNTIMVSQSLPNFHEEGSLEHRARRLDGWYEAFNLVTEAITRGCSFIYVKNEPLEFAPSLNSVLRITRASVRVKGELQLKGVGVERKFEYEAR